VSKVRTDPIPSPKRFVSFSWETPFQGRCPRNLAIAFAILTTVMFHSTMIGGDSFLPAVPACPPPKIDTMSWRVWTVESTGIRFKLPPRYKEHTWAVNIGAVQMYSYRAGHVDHIDIELESSANPDPSKHKVFQQTYYLEYTECAERIRNHEVVIQSFREEGAIFDQGRQYPMYEVMASCQLDSTRFLRISSGFASRQSQEEMLAMLRTIEFTQ
jgi:hypothetical protein